MKFRFIWNYQGHNKGMFERGPNWLQITIPGSRKLPRVAFIFWRPKGQGVGEGPASGGE